MMELKEHIRAVASHGLDRFTEDDLDRTVRSVQRSICQAKKGKTATLVEDIRNTAAIFRNLETAKKRGGAKANPSLRAYDSTKAYAALRAYVAFIIFECPEVKAELTELLAPLFDLTTTVH